MGLEEYGTQSGRQRKGVDGREADGDGHRDTKLLVEYAGRTGHERYRDKHQHHHQGNRDKRSGNLVHGVDGGAARRLVALVELGVHGLDHHDGIVDHNRDRKHQSRQGDEVDGEAYDIEHKECTYQRHRDGDGRDDGGAEVLQEYVCHQEHEHKCLDERAYHVVDRRVEEFVVVHRYLVAKTLGQLGLHALYLGEHVVDDLGGVGAGGLEHHRHRRGVAVGLVVEAVGHAAQLKLGHILEAQHLAVGGRAHHDLAKLLGGGEAAAVSHRVLERLVALLAECAGRGLDVLLAQGGSHVGGHQSVLRHHLGL